MFCPVQVTLNGLDYDAGGVRYHYFGMLAVHPMLGPAAGGTTIRINGTELTRGRPRTCRFGSTDVEASVPIGTADLLCVSPSMEGDAFGTVELRLSLNGVDFARVPANGNFTFYGEPVVTQIEPSSGSSGGGTLVRVTGDGLVSGGRTPLCRFGTAGLSGPAYPPT